MKSVDVALDSIQITKKVPDSKESAIECPLSPRAEGALATEAALRRVWDRPEEDEACRDL